jgi:hypothetical protein
MGGAGLIFGLMFVVLVVVVLAFSLGAIPGLGREAKARQEQAESGDDSLIYEVPEGQDPAAIVAALRTDGMDAVEVMRHGRRRIVISGPRGREALRPRARAVIAHQADLNLEGDPAHQGRVAFVDE